MRSAALRRVAHRTACECLVTYSHMWVVCPWTCNKAIPYQLVSTGATCPCASVVEHQGMVGLDTERGRSNLLCRGGGGGSESNAQFEPCDCRGLRYAYHVLTRRLLSAPPPAVGFDRHVAWERSTICHTTACVRLLILLRKFLLCEYMPFSWLSGFEIFVSLGRISKEN